MFWIVLGALVLLIVLVRVSTLRSRKSEVDQKASSDIEPSQPPPLNIQKPVAPTAPALAVRNIWKDIPQKTKDLLYVSSSSPTTFGPAYTISIRIDLDRGEVSAEEKPTDDPSTIYLNELIEEPTDTTMVQSPPYFPSFAGLSPTQKWVYLRWLTDVTSPIDIGFVFIFYYGLERSLLLSDFDSAFEMILTLRKYHDIPSFQSYSLGGLVYGTVYRNRPDRLSDLVFCLDEPKWDNEQLLISARLGRPLKPFGMASVIAGLRSLNRRYVKNNRPDYEQSLAEVLSEEYGEASIDLETTFPFRQLDRHEKSLFANYTFPEDVRSPKIPDYTQDRRFLKELTRLHERAHELTKENLKLQRNKGTT